MALPGKRRRMRAFKLNEISVVDNPAQEGARAVLMKREGNRVLYRGPSAPDLTTPTPAPVKVAAPEPKPKAPVRAANNEPATFEDAVKCLKRDFPYLNQVGALAEAARRYPLLLEKYQSDGVEVNAQSEAPLAKSEAVQAFEKAVDEVRKRERCSRTEALRLAARENPEALEEYRYARS